ncbi:MAG: type II toxin-antitoxin system HicB family antitoxin [Solirubrobacterales bacterium]|nr:type II toxin-antitoxin system HicB family antitoxin [Solirubrobacterales bacterium]
MSSWKVTTLTAHIHREGGAYWADVPELPGVFATGETLDELFESLREGVELVLEDRTDSAVSVDGALISIG